MSIPNPYYNPDWKAIHDFHSEWRDLTRQEINTGKPRVGTEEFEELAFKFKFHNKTCQHCLDTLQHKTVLDCAKWHFADTSMFSVDDSFIPPLESFKTIEEVKEAWARLSKLPENHEGPLNFAYMLKSSGTAS